MVFKKLTTHNKSEYVYGQIIEAIRADHYGPGDKLPSESELAEMAGVSRASVREALSALRLAGIIETKKGNGTFVRVNKLKAEPENNTNFDKDLNTFEMLEARRIVEPVVAGLALEVMEETDLVGIKDALDMMERVVRENDFEAYHQANKRFHFAIADASKNKSLSKYVRSLQVIFLASDFGAQLRHRYLIEEAYIHDSINSHRLIYEALKLRDKTLLARAWEKHDEGLEAQLLGK